MYKKKPETGEVSVLPLPELKPWTGKEKIDWTETDAWLAGQKGGYSPLNLDLQLEGGKRKKSKRGKSKRGRSKRGKSKRGKSKRGRNKSKRKRR